MNDILNVKDGDEVVYYPASGYGRQRIVSVDKVTPTGRIKIGSKQYDNTGREIGGDSWHRTRIGTATPEIIKQIKEDEYIREVFVLMQETKRLTYDQAVKIIAILKPETTEPNT